MADITKAYLDKKFKSLPTRDDLKPLATKQELKSFATKQEIKEEIDNLAVMIQRGFNDLAKRLDVRDRVDKLEKEMKAIKQALNI